MKRLKLLTALAMGVIASSSGMIQTQAALYTFNVDFGTKSVANFNDYTQTFSTDTYNLSTKLITRFSGTYFFDSCPAGTNSLNMQYRSFMRLNGAGTSLNTTTNELPNFLCTTTPTAYVSEIESVIPSSIVGALMQDDANFGSFFAEYSFVFSSPLRYRVLNLVNFRSEYTIEYDFNTTYLFNYFLSDTKFNSNSRTGSWLLRSNPRTTVDYVYTTAGNDEYRLVNSDFTANLGTTRTKYAIDYNQEFFRGSSVGARISRRYETDAPYNTDQYTLDLTNVWIDRYDYYFLNTANLAQAIVDAPIISFTEEDCSGGFLDVNVGCYVNNAFAYIVNDAPVISDAFTLLNTGIELAAQTFGVIGNFSDDNVFGYLILIGFGFIAVKWFLKNDE